MSYEHRWLALAVLSVLVLFVLIFFIKVSPAHDQDHPELNDWFQSLKNQNRVACCDGTDAKHLSDIDWDTKRDAGGQVHYRVFIENKWWDVPDEAVIDGPNKSDMAQVWPVYYRNSKNPDDLKILIRCFLPGTGT